MLRSIRPEHFWAWFLRRGIFKSLCSVEVRAQLILVLMKNLLDTLRYSVILLGLIPLVLGSHSLCYGVDVTLEWAQNAESEAVGYKLYYKSGSSGPPYTGSGASEGDSPVVLDSHDVCVNDACRFKLTDLNEVATHYFVVTAYDTAGLESDYSNEVCFSGDAGFEKSPAISDIWPLEAEPNTEVVIFGSGFGNTQQDGVVHIGSKDFGPGDPSLEFWSDAIIEIKIPFGARECEWWGGEDLKGRKVWVTVGGLDSNMLKMWVMKPLICP
jgi:hypothetical protein